jgi:RNA-binding protein YhbY
MPLTLLSPHAQHALLPVSLLGFKTHIRNSVLQRPLCTQPERKHCMLLIAGAAKKEGYQRPLTSSERKAKRAESQRLGKALVTYQLGQRGLTPTFLQGVADALKAHGLCKVSSAKTRHGLQERHTITLITHLSHYTTISQTCFCCEFFTKIQIRLGDCDLDRDQAAEELQHVLDCIAVHKIGSTLTIYRDKGLPFPPPLLKQVLQEVMDMTHSNEDEDDVSSEEEDATCGKAVAGPPPPPEFTILS